MSLTVFVAAAAPVGAAKPKPPIKVFGNDRVLLEDPEGGYVLSCVPSLDDARRPRVMCGMVEFRSGFIIGVVPGSYVVEVSRAGLTVSHDAPGSADQVFAEPRPRRALFGAFARRKSGRTLDFSAGGRYGFSGTSVGCSGRSAYAVTCFLVDARFRPLPSSHGFTLGFGGVQVIRVDRMRRRTIVLNRRHG